MEGTHAFKQRRTRTLRQRLLDLDRLFYRDRIATTTEHPKKPAQNHALTVASHRSSPVMSFVLKADFNHTQKQTLSEVLACGIAIFEQRTVTLMQRLRE
jgi:7,8-dihydro-6-hydroxymethylpterin-pyrophosphokinase